MVTVEFQMLKYCLSLKEVIIADGITTIKSESFADCISLTKIVIPSSVQTIGERAFANCPELTIFFEGDELPVNCSANWNPDSRPVVLNAEKHTYSFESNGGSEVEDITDYAIGIYPIPTKDGYVFIGWYDNEELTGKPVEFPYYNAEKTTLYAKWFDLEGNSLNEGLEIVDGKIVGIGTCKDKILYLTLPVGDEAFDYNTDIEKVYFLYGATSVGNRAFKDCIKLNYVYVGEGVDYVCESAFENCVSLTSVYISSTVKELGCSAFSGCLTLSTVDFSENISISKIMSSCFGNCSMLKSIRIPDSVTAIESSAFINSGLTSMLLGDNIVSIGEGAFRGCKYLESFTIPDSVLTVEADVFNGCHSLKSMVINNGITAIKRGAFLDCRQLKSIIISETVITMGENVFEGCYDLVIFLKGSVKPSTWVTTWNPHNRPVVLNAVMHTYSFESNGGSEIDDVTDYAISNFPISKKDGNILLGWYDNPELTGDTVKLPYYNAEKTTIYAKWFDIGSATENDGLYIEDGVIKGIGDCTDTVLYINKPVGENAFYGCDKITHVIIGEGATSLANNAFASCEKLEMVAFISNMTPELGSNLFGGTWDKSTFKIYVPSDVYEYYKTCNAEYWQSYVVSAGKLTEY